MAFSPDTMCIRVDSLFSYDIMLRGLDWPPDLIRPPSGPPYQLTAEYPITVFDAKATSGE